MGPGYLLEVNGKKILIDAGQGVVIQLLKLGVKIEDLDYIFITHFHGDHNADLLPIMLRFKPVEVARKIKIFGQTGTKKFVSDVFSVFHHNPGDSNEVIEFDNTIKLDGFMVTSVPVIHTDISAVAYRFEMDGKTLVFSGDTTICEGIKIVSKDADLFIVDSSNPKGIETDCHLNTAQIGQICKDSNVKKVVLSHLKSEVVDKDLVSEVKEEFDGEVVLAKDLMSFEV